MQPNIILASTSPYRKALLEKLLIPFSCQKPFTDETPLEGETPHALVSRLSQLKAQAVANDNPNALIIGSDQVCIIDGVILGKPKNYENATRQLSQASGKQVTFLTGLCVLNSATGHVETIVEPYSVTFRQLSPTMIKHYLLAEQPYNCAGSFKSEGLGITLFEKFEGEDPNSLIGLPLIKLISLFAKHGFNLLEELTP